MSYHDTTLFIGGHWVEARSGRTLDVINPATEEVIGQISSADIQDLERAVEAAEQGLRVWRETSGYDRSLILTKAAELLRQRAAEIGRRMTMEQGKPLSESTFECVRAAGELEWAAGEARRTYGRVIPSRDPHSVIMTARNPVGAVALFSPWNFPLNQLVRKLAPALAAGCSVVAKAAEETPASPAALVQALHDAGLPPGVVNLVFGEPATISKFLIAHPSIRKVSFTGSVVVGKQLAALAGQYMKRATMELGGHAPVVICEDADIDLAIAQMSKMKPFNAGQTCASPNRILVHERHYTKFMDGFTSALSSIRVGDGLAEGIQMGPLANRRRLHAMEEFCTDVKANGGRIVVGGNRLAGRGYFFSPTIVDQAPTDAKVMQVESFGPIVVVIRFRDLDEVIAEANRLPYALAAYAYSQSIATVTKLARTLECGNLIANDAVLALPEMPFGGIKESGFGMEGGTEGIDAYLATKLLSLR